MIKIKEQIRFLISKSSDSDNDLVSVKSMTNIIAVKHLETINVKGNSNYNGKKLTFFYHQISNSLFLSSNKLGTFYSSISLYNQFTPLNLIPLLSISILPNNNQLFRGSLN